MPEGPEIYTLKEYLKKEITGKRVKKIISKSKTKVRLPKESKIEKVEAKGKLIWIKTKEYYMHIHLMLTGWIYIDEEPENVKYIIELNGKKIYISSRRKFTKLEIYNKKKHKEEKEKLGVDILSEEFTKERFRELIKKTRKMISAYLMEQKTFAGLGNYIKNESLYISEIDPEKASKELEEKEIERLYKAIKYVSYSTLIEQLEDYEIKIPKEIKKRRPKKIQIPYRYKIYGREKDDKGREVRMEKIGGRKTYYVEKVQKKEKKK